MKLNTWVGSVIVSNKDCQEFLTEQILEQNLAITNGEVS